MSRLSERLDEGFFRSAIESSVDCIKVLDLEGRVQFVNAAGLSVLGVEDISALQGKPWGAFWPDPAASKITQALGAAKRGEHFRFEAQARFGSGAVKSWDVILSPLRDPDGGVEGLIATCRDVTDVVLGRWTRAFALADRRRPQAPFAL